MGAKSKYRIALLYTFLDDIIENEKSLSGIPGGEMQDKVLRYAVPARRTRKP